MNHKKRTLIIVILVALGVYGFFAVFESFEEMRDVGWSSAARYNPFLAAEHFLARSGLHVQSADQFQKLKNLPPKGTLFMNNSTHVLSSKHLEILIVWIKNGGHLIIASEAPERKKTDRLLAHFSIENQVATGENFSEDSVEGTSKKPKKVSEQLRELNAQLLDSLVEDGDEKTSFEAGIPKNEQTALVFDDLGTEVRAHFLQDRTLYHPYFDWEDDADDFEGYRPYYWQGDAQGIHFIQMQVEQGRLSVLSDAEIWRSKNIAYFDHAYLLQVLTEDSDGVYILYGMNVPSVLALIGRHAPELVFSAIFCFVAWLFYRGLRFGPTKTVTLSRRRSMAEHVRASAAYLWRGNFKPQLLTPLQAEIEQRACRVVPTFENLDKKARFLHLSLQSGLALPEIENAMYSGDLQTEADFVQTVSCLQKIRRSL